MNNSETTYKPVATYKLWEQNPSAAPVRNMSDRSWQVKLPEKEPLFEARTIPLIGANPVVGRPTPSDRNLKRITAPKKLRFRHR